MTLPIPRVDESKAATPPQPDNFTGPARIQRLSDEARAQDFEIFAVFFDAGSRTRPHTHPGEQYLYFLRGNGFVHLEGEELQQVEEGGIVVIPAGVVHMHGALDEPICHIATRSANGPTDWNPPVPDEWQQHVAAE